MSKTMTFGFSQSTQKELDEYKFLPFEKFKEFSEIDNKRISFALYENFPFGKELKSESDKIIISGKDKDYFKDESSIINYKCYFYNEFYNFLFKVITKFDELNIDTERDEKEKEKYFNYATGNDFKTRVKTSITYSKYVTKRFFELYPQLKTQFKQKRSKIIDTKSKKIIDQGSDNKLVEWYSTEKFQRLMILIDFKKTQSDLFKSNKRNLTKPERLKLYKEIISKYEAQKMSFEVTRLKFKKPKYSTICNNINDREKLKSSKKQSIDIWDEFKRWRKRNPDEYNLLVLKIRNIIALQGYIDLGGNLELP